MTDPLRAASQLIRDWRSAGLTHLPRARSVEIPQSDSRRGAQEVTSPATARDAAPASASPTGIPQHSISQLNIRQGTQLSLAERETQLSALAECVAGCQRCPELARTRTQTVFGVGDPQARLMFIGEAPGADEDRQGIPFVGRAGQLMNKIIEASGFSREELYICNILRCRPPGNRTPNETEAANCREYLDAQIATVSPEYIVCWGSCAAQNLLGTKEAIGKMRQRFFEHAGSKVLCTYHPSYLLRNPPAKKHVWEDMKFLLAEMGLPVPEN